MIWWYECFCLLYIVGGNLGTFSACKELDELKDMDKVAELLELVEQKREKSGASFIILENGGEE